MNTEQKLDEALSFIEHSRTELKSGDVVSLQGFDSRVKTICEEIGNLPPEEMAINAAKLTLLSEAITSLERELVAQRDEVQQEILKINQKQKALKLYATVNHSDNKTEN